MCSAIKPRGLVRAHSRSPWLQAILVMKATENWLRDDAVLVTDPMTARDRREIAAIGNPRSETRVRTSAIRRSDLSPGESVAESVRGTRDRLDPSRVSGSCNRAQSGASATRPLALQPVLPSKSDASGAREGRARSPTGLGTVRWRDHRDSGSRRSPSPVRTEGRVSAKPAGAPVLNGGAAKARVTRRLLFASR